MATINKAKTEGTVSEMTQLQSENNKEVQSLEAKRTALTDHYKNEKKFTVIGAPMYRGNFGNAMPISINGVLISVPLDGRRYEIPESFAQVFNARILSVNEQLEQQRALSDVGRNEEQFPGELDLIRPV